MYTKSSNSIFDLYASSATAKSVSGNADTVIDDGFKDGFSLCSYSNDTYTGSGTFSNITANLTIYYI